MLVVDFSTVEAEAAEMHGRLLNWARSLRDHRGASAHPMWRLYRPDSWERTGAVIAAVDVHDAHRVQKGVIALPLPHRGALDWYYVRDGYGMLEARRRLGVTRQMLDRLVRDGRRMLINRGV